MQFCTSRIFALACVYTLAFALPAIAQDSQAPSPETASASATTPTQFLFVPLGNNSSFGANDNRMQEYRINSTTGALTVIKKAFEAQNSAAFTFRDPTHRFLYLEGAARSSNFFEVFSEYKVNTATGALTTLPGSPFGTANHQALAFGAIRNDLKFAYILDFQSVNILHIISMNPSTGAMVKEVSTFNLPGSGSALFSLSFDPSGRFLYVVEGENNVIDAFVSNPTTGALTPVRGSPFVPRGSFHSGCSPKLNFCGGSAAITASNHLYYVSILFNGIAEFKIDPNTGALTELAGSPAPDPESDALNVHATADGKHLYVSSSDSNAIVGYTINTATGELTKVAGSPVTVPGAGNFMELDATGKFLYTANGDTISGFHINSTTGVLTPVPGSPYSSPGNSGISIIH